MLEDHPQRLRNDRVVDGVQAQRQHRAAPVDSLGDGRHFLELHAAQHTDDAYQLLGEALGQLGHSGQQDAAFQIGTGKVNVQEQATPLERLGQLASRVGGQQHERRPGRGDCAQFGYGHREVGQHLEQQAFDFDVGFVGLVDQQHCGLGTPDGRQQRTLQQELLAEYIVSGRVPVTGAGLDAQNLFGVVPLVQCASLVYSLVALQPD